MRNQNKELYEEAAKMKLGVRKDDEYWDNRILKLCKDSAIK